MSSQTLVSSSLRKALSQEKTPQSDQPTGTFFHEPVLVEEVVAFLDPKPGKIIVDGTLGGGGHAQRCLEAGAMVIGIDRDPAAVAYAKARLADFGDRFLPLESNYAKLQEQLQEIGVQQVDGILLDLGVSSYQLDTAERGFSFQQEGPLDMRMGKSSQTAAQLLNTATEEELSSLFREYGEEPRARAMARKILQARERYSLRTTTQLAALLALGVPRGPRHPATRVFQALRIAVNEEMKFLEATLPQLPKVLVAGGSLAIITFHSLEDRLVKRFLQQHSASWLDDPSWPAPRPNPQCLFTLPKNWSLKATAGEVANNPRARSARLRLAKRC